MKALQKMGLVFATALIMGTVFGCQQPQPAQCVCNCEGPPPEGAKIVIDEKQSETKSEEVKAQPAAPAVAAPVPAAPAARPTPPARVPRKARGRVSAEPGSGMPKVMGEADKTEMQTVFEGFAKAAKERNVGEMKKFTTERLGKILESSLEVCGTALPSNGYVQRRRFKWSLYWRNK